MTLYLGLAALACGVAHIVADYRHAWTATYLFKPLTMVAIIAVVALPPGAYPALRVWVIAGLCLSLIGDVFLMLRPARFLAGLVSFLVAHLAYCAAFVAAGAGLWWPALLPVLLGGLLMARLLWPGLDGMRVPVAVYISAIVLMVWLALSLWHGVHDRASGLLATGAVLFMISDAVLGYARFRDRFWSAQALILGSYYAGQWLIANGALALSLGASAAS